MLKVSWILWWIVTAFWFILYLSVSAFLWLREVDGTGTVQTPELKLIAIGIWSAFFIIPCIIQIIWFIFNLIKSKK
ncbi:DUF3923 family protein [Staphylococcus hyicus]|uniref:DUF3923 family protein n=1 Tax=Staphylococcus hyicus TaxID=1284 RepID=UPI00217D7E3D|nr:DUF3923 family protein [Staphylococcus hyicus]UWF56766.1 DUF3923 family protein [Staphylococcus hyicus]